MDVTEKAMLTMIVTLLMRACDLTRGRRRSDDRTRNEGTLSHATLRDDAGVGNGCPSRSRSGNRCWGWSWKRRGNRSGPGRLSWFFLVEVIVKSEIRRRRLTVNIGPPVADEVTLIEDCSHGAKE